MRTLIFTALFCFFFSWAAQAQVTTLSAGQSALMQSSGGSNAGGVSVEPDEFTGSANYSISLMLPPARGDVKPNLTLTYNSQRRNPNSWVGYGWELDFGQISRVPDTFGHMNYMSGQDFEVRYGGQSESLELTAADVDPADYDLSSYVNSNTQVDLYHARVESAFNLYLHMWDDLSSGFPQSLGWVVVDKSGTKFFYGTTQYAREEHDHCPNLGGNITVTCLPRNWVANWKLNKVVDVNGNVFEIQYDSAGYPEVASYQDVTVEFEVANDATKFPSFKQTFVHPNTVGRRLENITISSNGQRLQKYLLSYEPISEPSNHFDRLTAVQQLGATDSAYLPATVFDYYNFNPEFDGPYTRQASRSHAGYTHDGRMTFHINFADMNGDGLQDQVVSYPHSVTDTVYVYFNNGNEFEYIPGRSEWTDPFVGILASCDYESTNWCSGRVTAYAPKDDGKLYQISYLMDINGDGLADRVYSNVLNPEATQAEFLVALNNGRAWSSTNQVWNEPVNTTYASLSYDLKFFMDMNGDGLPDRVFGDPQNGQFHIYFNTGGAFSTTPETWEDPLAIANPNHNGRGKLLQADSKGTYAFIRDMNGDGLPDRVWYATTDLYDQNDQLLQDQDVLIVALNRAGKEFAPIGPSQTINEYADGVNIYILVDPIEEEEFRGYITDRHDWMDFNGDGFLDRVVSHHDEAPDPGKIKVYLFNGTSQNSNVSFLSNPIVFDDPVTSTFDDKEANGYLRRGIRDNSTRDPRYFTWTMDMNGDRYPDRVVVDGAGSGGSNDYKIYPLKVNPLEFSETPSRLNDNKISQPSDVLKSVEDGLTNKTVLEYTLSNVPYDYPNPTHRFLPFSMHLVHKVYTRDYTLPTYGSGPVEGVRNPGFRWTTLSYFGGNTYFRQALRQNPYTTSNLTLTQTRFFQFNGFQTVSKVLHKHVNETWSDFVVEKTMYQAEGDVQPHPTSLYASLFGSNQYSHFSLSGKPYQIITSENGNLIGRETHGWQINGAASGDFLCQGVCHPKLDNTHKETWEPGSSTSKISSATFEYDDLGNLTKEIYLNRNEQELIAKDTAYFDEGSFQANLHIRNRPDWQKKNQGGTTLRYKSFLYDSLGNPTEERFHKDDSGSSFHAVTRTYYPNGNLETITDLTGVTKELTYDSENLFPTSESVTYPNGTTLSIARTYNRLLGEIEQQINENGTGEEQSFDDFGRPLTKKIIDRSGQEYLTSSFEYEFIDATIENDTNRKLIKTTVYQPQPGYPETNPGGGQPAKISYSDGSGSHLQECLLSERGDFRAFYSRQYNGGRHLVKTEPQFVSSCSFQSTIPSSLRISQTFKDLQGRPTQILPPSGDANSPVGTVTIAYGIDGLGRSTRTLTHSSGQSKTEVYDYKDRLTSVTDHDGSTITHDYNSVGDLTKVYNDGQLMTEVSHDLLGRKEQMIDADLGTWNYSYNANMQLLYQVDNKGQRREFDYDSFGRVIRKDYFDAGEQLEKYEVFTYDQGESGYNVMTGELGKVEEFDGAGVLLRSTLFGYDEDFRINNKVTRNIAGLGEFTQTTESNYLGQVLSEEYPTGEALHYSYNNLGSPYRLCENESCDESTGEIYYEIDSSSAFNVYGNLLKETLGNGVEHEFEYYTNSQRLKIAKISKGSQIFSRREYQFDEKSNITNLLDLQNPSGQSSGAIQNVQYDAKSRIRSYEMNQSTVSLEYDSLGNMTKNSKGYGSEIYQYNSSRPHAVTQIGSENFQYDDNGNMIQDGSRSMVYNTLNQLAQVTMNNGAVVNFSYDYTGHRIGKQVTRIDPNGREQTAQVYYLGNALEIRGDKMLLHISAAGKKVATKTLGNLSELVASTGGHLNNVHFRYASFYLNNYNQILMLGFFLMLWILRPTEKYGFRKSIQETFMKLRYGFFRKSVSFALVLIFFSITPLQHAQAGNTPTTLAQSDSDYFYYVHTDHLGSSHVLTEGKKEGGKHSGIFYKRGELLQRIEYAPFGEETFVLNPNLRFDPSYTGQLYDTETGLYYYKARYYNPKLGRFIQPDTLVPDGKNFDAYNRYSYVINNPLKYNDPSGHFFKKFFKSFLGGLIALIATVILTIATAGVFAAVAGVSMAALSASQLMVAGVIGSLLVGVGSAAISGAGLTGMLLGGLFAAFGAFASAGLSTMFQSLGMSAGVSKAVLGFIGASISYATGGLDGMMSFAAGFAGALAGGKILKAFDSQKNSYSQSSKKMISKEEFQSHIDELNNIDITDPKLARQRDKVVSRLQKNLDTGKLVNDPNLPDDVAGSANGFTKKIKINPSMGYRAELTYTLAHEGAHVVWPFKSHLSIYQFEWDIANANGHGYALFGGKRPTKEWLKVHLSH